MSQKPDGMWSGPEFYRWRLKEYGPTAKGQGWFDEETQQLRFDRAMSSIPPKGTLLDVGCGVGDLYAALQQKGWKGQYVGIDNVPEMIEHAKARYPEADFQCHNLWEVASEVDTVVALGVMTWEWDTMRVIQHLWRMTRVVLIYTHRSMWGPIDQEVDVVMDPADALKVIRCPLTVIRQDYHSREFMAIHYKAQLGCLPKNNTGLDK